MKLHYGVKVGEAMGKAIRQSGYSVNGRTESTRFDVVRPACGERGPSTTSRVAFWGASDRCVACEGLAPSKKPDQTTR